MKNEKHPIDDLFKEKLNNSAFDMPSGKEAAWNRLQIFMEAGNAKAANEERQRKAFAFWPMWAAASVSLLCLGGLIYYYQTKLPVEQMATQSPKKIESLEVEKNTGLAFSSVENISTDKKDSLQSATPSAKSGKASNLEVDAPKQTPAIEKTKERLFKSADSYKKLNPAQVPVYITKDISFTNEVVALNEGIQSTELENASVEMLSNELSSPNNENSNKEVLAAIVPNAENETLESKQIGNISSDDNLEEITVLIEIHPGNIRKNLAAQNSVASSAKADVNAENYVANRRGKKLNKDAPTSTVRQFFASLWRYKQGRASSDELRNEGKRLYATFQNDSNSADKPIE